MSKTKTGQIFRAMVGTRTYIHKAYRRDHVGCHGRRIQEKANLLMHASAERGKLQVRGSTSVWIGVSF